MSHAFADIAFTPAVKAAQTRDGSRAGYARAFERDDGEVSHREIGPDEVTFIAEQRSFVMATVSETGWPYVQHRGGPKGFLKVLDARRLAFADFAGNRQLISVGNVAGGSDRVALLLIDYANRVRLKVLGRLEVRDLSKDDPLFAQLVDPAYAAKPQRAFVVTVEAFDWNCPQHIPTRIDAEDVQRALDARDARIAELEAQAASAR
jgi:predicted pyridoxine 5'-phosphate oxidase superfamily flavin-nucleotide-binding protein